MFYHLTQSVKCVLMNYSDEALMLFTLKKFGLKSKFLYFSKKTNYYL